MYTTHYVLSAHAHNLAQYVGRVDVAVMSHINSDRSHIGNLGVIIVVTFF